MSGELLIALAVFFGIAFGIGAPDGPRGVLISLGTAGGILAAMAMIGMSR
jgi:hypothetical protein